MMRRLVARVARWLLRWAEPAAEFDEIRARRARLPLPPAPTPLPRRRASDPIPFTPTPSRGPCAFCGVDEGMHVLASGVPAHDYVPSRRLPPGAS